MFVGAHGAYARAACLLFRGSSENGVSVTYLDEEATLGIMLAFPLLLLVLDLFVEVALAVLIILMTAILLALASLRLRVRSVRAHRDSSRTITNPPQKTVHQAR